LIEDKTASLLQSFKTMILKPSKELKGVDLLERQEECSHWLVCQAMSVNSDISVRVIFTKSHLSGI